MQNVISALPTVIDNNWSRFIRNVFLDRMLTQYVKEDWQFIDAHGLNIQDQEESPWGFCHFLWGYIRVVKFFVVGTPFIKPLPPSLPLCASMIDMFWSNKKLGNSFVVNFKSCNLNLTSNSYNINWKLIANHLKDALTNTTFKSHFYCFIVSKHLVGTSTD